MCYLFFCVLPATNPCVESKAPWMIKVLIGTYVFALLENLDFAGADINFLQHYLN